MNPHHPVYPMTTDATFIRPHLPTLALGLLAVLPLLAAFVEVQWGSHSLMAVVEGLCPLLIFGVLVTGLHLVTGTTGALHLGVAGFMALGAYTFAILSSPVYPFQVPWGMALLGSGAMGALFGVLLGIPVLRLRGDYFAIVSLGFGEIVQDALRNMEPVTKGTVGINPIPGPALLDELVAGEGHLAWLGKGGWFYLLFVILLMIVGGVVVIERTSLGRGWAALRDDELAARCMGVIVSRAKVYAMILGSAVCGLAGGLWVSYLGASGEPGNYDVQVSVIVLCGLILGGMGNVWGAVVGVFIMVGFNSLVLTRITELFTDVGWVSSGNVIASPLNWKYLIFGLSLVLLMRYRPEGLFPAKIRRTPERFLPRGTSGVEQG